MITRDLSVSYEQRRRVFYALTEQAKTAATAADPATGGVRHLVHNWGNPASRAVWADFDRRWARAARAYDARRHTYATPVTS